MSSRETVIELVKRLPEEMPLAEIAREIELLAGIQFAREQANRREGIPAQDARQLVDSWAAQKNYSRTMRGGVPVLPSRGELITHEHVQKLRDEEGM